jgi:hypothetical protein
MPKTAASTLTIKPSGDSEENGCSNAVLNANSNGSSERTRQRIQWRSGYYEPGSVWLHSERFVPEYFRAVLVLVAGATYRLDARTSAGALLEGRQRVVPGGSPRRELMGFWTRRLEGPRRSQIYGLIGLADGSPDWGFGLSLPRPL